jgi:hypothetical protein
MRFNLNMMNDFGDEKSRQAKRQDLSIMRLLHALYAECNQTIWVQLTND